MALPDIVVGRSPTLRSLRLRSCSVDSELPANEWTLCRLPNVRDGGDDDDEWGCGWFVGGDDVAQRRDEGEYDNMNMERHTTHRAHIEHGTKSGETI